MRFGGSKFFFIKKFRSKQGGMQNLRKIVRAVLAPNRYRFIIFLHSAKVRNNIKQTNFRTTMQTKRRFIDKVNLKLCAHGRQTKKTKRSRIPKPLYLNNKQIDSKYDKLIQKQNTVRRTKCTQIIDHKNKIEQDYHKRTYGKLAMHNLTSHFMCDNL